MGSLERLVTEAIIQKRIPFENDMNLPQALKDDIKNVFYLLKREDIVRRVDEHL